MYVPDVSLVMVSSSVSVSLEGRKKKPDKKDYRILIGTLNGLWHFLYSPINERRIVGYQGTDSMSDSREKSIRTHRP